MSNGEVLQRRELVEKRYFELGKAAFARFLREVDGPEDGSVYDMVEDADKIQLENPKGKERWEVIVARNGSEVVLRQLFYSDAGGTWQIGNTFFFDGGVLEELIELEMGIGPGEVDEPFMADDRYFTGLTGALDAWPIALWYVTPIEDRV